MSSELQFIEFEAELSNGRKVIAELVDCSYEEELRVAEAMGHSFPAKTSEGDYINCHFIVSFKILRRTKGS